MGRCTSRTSMRSLSYGLSMSRETGPHKCHYASSILGQSPVFTGSKTSYGKVTTMRHLVCKPWQNITSSLVIVRSSPGVAVLPVMALTPISKARPSVPLVEYQYRISSGMTWIIETRGSLASPLWTPSFKSPNHADVLRLIKVRSYRQLWENTYVDEKQSLMVSRSRLTLALPENLKNYQCR